MAYKHRLAVLAVYLLFATASSFAAVTITSVTPNSGSSAGGTEVLIHGTDFTEIIGSPSHPPAVFFGFTLAYDIEHLGETTLRVKTPPHLPGVVDVTVASGAGAATAEQAFTFVGDEGHDHFDRILLPLLIPPAPGAFGSEWHTELEIDSSRVPDRRAEVYGLKQVCPPPPRQCGTRDLFAPLLLPSAEVGPVRVEKTGTPGRFLYVPDSQVEKLTMHLRIRDVTRDDENFGTEIPIIRERDFKTGRIVLLGVPTDPRFRNTLRIYSTINWPMRVTVEGQPPVDLMLSTAGNVFEPAYGVFTNFPAGNGPVTVIIEPTPNALPVVPPPFWAFIAVTNNTTQMVTTITPEP
jgi:IPT/TIG domain